MRFSWSWLADWVDLTGIEPARGAELLTSVGLAVELVEPHGDDTVLDVDVTTNRPDAMNHRGLARELAAALGRDLKSVARPLPAASGAMPANLVAIEATDLCPRYAARLISGVKVAPSPAWLATRLEAVGLRPINNVVDATNYVLQELGHPLHAFDRDLLAEGRIVVRRARPDEPMTTLDGLERKLSSDMLVIADAARPVAVAGVMGGEHSGVSEKTTNLLLESAWFAPDSVRKTSKALALHTDASHRFERGADYDAPLEAVDAVASLILALAGGTLHDGTVDVRDDAKAPLDREVLLRRSRVARIAGCSVPDDFIAPTLARLGLDATPTSEGWVVEIPRRRVDLEIEDDLVEEVLRHFGYDQVPTVAPAWPPSEGSLSESKRRENAVRETLLAAGIDEVVTYSFVSVAEEKAVEGEEGVAASPVLDNPIAETQGILRTTTLASLLPSAAHNVRHGRREVALFEVGRGFRLDGEAIREHRLAGFVLGGRWPHDWHGRKGPEFADAKGIVESVLDRLGVLDRAVWAAAGDFPLARNAFAPGRAAVARIDGRDVAVVGELAPQLLHHYDLGSGWVAGEIRLGEIVGAGPGTGTLEKPELPAPPTAFAFRPFSRFPAIELDLTVEHDGRRDLAEMLAYLRGLPAPVGELLESVLLKDRYDGKGVPEGKVRTTLTFVYRRGDRSLTQEEIRPVHEEVVGQFVDRFEGRRA